jgi:hypothetical protein
MDVAFESKFAGIGWATTLRARPRIRATKSIERGTNRLEPQHREKILSGKIP